MAKIRIVRDGIYRDIDEFRWHEFKSKGFVKVAEPATETPDTDETGTDKTGETPRIDKMTVEQLKKYADDNGIDLGEATKKTDIIEAIKNVLATKEETADDEPAEDTEADTDE